MMMQSSAMIYAFSSETMQSLLGIKKGISFMKMGKSKEAIDSLDRSIKI